MIDPSYIAPLVKLAIDEDIRQGDITSAACIDSNLIGEGKFLCKEDGVLAGIEVIDYIITGQLPDVSFQSSKKEGEKIFVGEYFATIEGKLQKILTFERTLLNFLQRMSGVATLTSRFVDAVNGTKARILDTRKTIPGWRYLDKLAVEIGGGENHRFGLFDMFLIKDNHIIAAKGITNAVKLCKDYREKNNLNYKIEVEVKNLAELNEALALQIDRIMLDNFKLDDMKKAVELNSGKCELEVSGGVNLDSVRAIAETGVDYISIGALTHSVKALDISLDL
ncbi:MAG: carboxylating nicotinate-nucleotide diphosphorylase [Bacteroidetes bacterium]|nr:carboxylating nicotinate-nucleotide diphosphorylase [Bacteroidota bacterium]MBU2586204.1 carboxylating nicotinate-nucleotide diphosphorylase [Bacteroidota bacterium]